MHDALQLAMSTATFYPHDVAAIKKVETHISIIFLTGQFAYKIKKPVDFGFLNFSTLALRKHFCEEELRLNQRLAKQLYLDVVPVYYHEGVFSLQGRQEHIVEYAVKMRQFDPANQLDELIKQNAITLQQMDALSICIADFHQHVEKADVHSDVGEPKLITQPCFDNFSLIYQSLNTTNAHLQVLEAWTKMQAETLEPVFIARKQQGFIRECHGDMHLGNIAIIDEAFTLFDCIEFSKNLRWVDTLSDLAFLLMDLHKQGKTVFAYRLLNTYLAITGDYEGLSVLNFYLVYRALVRAKIAGLQGQLEPLERYVELAYRFIETKPPQLIITFGVSGSGKSYGSRKLSDHYGWIHLRSDVERKRLLGMHMTERGRASELYTPIMTESTYSRLLAVAEAVLLTGRTVIVDATFLKYAERERFHQLALQLGVDYQILHFQANRKQLEENIKKRQQRDDDPSDADVEILERQLRHSLEPLQETEMPFSVSYSPSDNGMSNNISF
jgi:aminoglycoside phosphotransferase family enzyme/predicted kinase